MKTIHQILTELNIDFAEAYKNRKAPVRCSSWAELLQTPEDFDAQAEVTGSAPDIQNEGV